LLVEYADHLVSLVSGDGEDLQAAGRYVAQQLVLLTQANLLRRHAPSHVADAFVQSRFAGRGGRLYGVFDRKTPTAALFQRAWHE